MTQPTPIFQTKRLTVVPFDQGDTGFILELLNSPGWIRYIGDRKVKTATDALAYLDNGPLASYREHGFGLWRVDHQEEKKPIGMCGLLKRPELEGPDLGFAFLPHYHGQGYGNEAAAATIRFAQDTLGLKELLAIVQPDNAASIGLLVKNGFTFDKVITAGANMELLQLYRLPFYRVR